MLPSDPSHSRAFVPLLWLLLAKLLLLDITSSVSAVDVACSGGCDNATSLCNTMFKTTGGAVMSSSQCQPMNTTTPQSNATSSVFDLRCLCSPSASVNATGLEVPVVLNMDTGVCQLYLTTFESSPTGSTCTPTTGMCPTSSDCNSLTSSFASGCANSMLSCSTLSTSETAFIATTRELNATLKLSCYSCDGATYTIYVDEHTNTCEKQMTAGVSTCTGSNTCRGHGCCAPVGSDASHTQAVGSCSCYADGVRGFWSTSSQCASCDLEYDSQGKGGPCTNQKPQLVVLLQTLGATSPAAMVLPNLFIVVAFVIFGTVRRVWISDDEFDITMLRRAGISWRRSRISVHDPAWVALPLLSQSNSSSSSGSGPTGGGGSAIAGGGGSGREGSSAGVAGGGGGGDGRGGIISSGASGIASMSGHGGSGLISAATGFMMFRAKTIPKRPEGNCGIVHRWEKVCAERMRQ